jgi:hypothetical protein
MTHRQDDTQEQRKTLEVLQGEDEILRFAQDDTVWQLRVMPIRADNEF